MNLGDDYENVSLGKPSPWPLGPFLRIEPHPAHRTPRMAQAALVLLTLALLASLTAVVIIYFQVETCTSNEDAQRKTCLQNVTALTSEMQTLRSRLGKLRAQMLELDETRSGSRDIPASSAAVDRLKEHLETVTVLPVPLRWGHTSTSGVGLDTLEGPTEDPVFGGVTEPPRGSTEKGLEFGGATEAPGIRTDRVSASAPVHTDVKTLKALLGIVNASFAALREEYSIILTLLSKGWKFYSGNLYYFSPKKMSWYEAEKFCVSWGSHLTSVASVGEQEFLLRRAKGTPFWIGLTSHGTEGTWHWVDGTPFNEANSRRFWTRGPSRSWKMGDRCVEMQFKDRNLWNERDCQSLVQGLCRKALKRFEEDPDVGSRRTELD